jgi:hypothetical protein
MPTKKAATAAKARSKPVAPAGGASRARPSARKEEDDEDGIGLDDEQPPPSNMRTVVPLLPFPFLYTDAHRRRLFIMDF